MKTSSLLLLLGLVAMRGGMPSSLLSYPQFPMVTCGSLESTTGFSCLCPRGLSVVLDVDALTVFVPGALELEIGSDRLPKQEIIFDHLVCPLLSMDCLDS